MSFQRAYQYNKNYKGLNFNLAVCYFELHDFENTVKYCSQEIALHPDYYDAYRLRANCLIELNEFDKAEADIFYLIENDMTAYEYFLKGILLFNKQDYTGAFEAYNNALIRDSSNIDFLIKRAATYGVLGSNHLAIEDCNRALIKQPENVDALVLRAYNHQLLGEYENACNDYNKVKSLDVSELYNIPFYWEYCE